jgi:hypothetical protein
MTRIRDANIRGLVFIANIRYRIFRGTPKREMGSLTENRVRVLEVCGKTYPTRHNRKKAFYVATGKIYKLSVLGIQILIRLDPDIFGPSGSLKKLWRSDLSPRNQIGIRIIANPLDLRTLN